MLLLLILAALPVSGQQTEASVILRLTDGTPVLVTGSPRAGLARDPAATGSRGPMIPQQPLKRQEGAKSGR